MVVTLLQIWQAPLEEVQSILSAHDIRIDQPEVDIYLNLTELYGHASMISDPYYNNTFLNIIRQISRTHPYKSPIELLSLAKEHYDSDSSLASPAAGSIRLRPPPQTFGSKYSNTNGNLFLSITQAKTISKIKSVTNNFLPIQVLSWHPKDTPYYELSPYYLKTDGLSNIACPAGVIFENYWQGNKVYDYVYDIEVYPHFRFKGRPEYLWFQYVCDNGTGKEQHYDSILDEINPKWLHWRDQVRLASHGIRYPNGRSRTKFTQFSYDWDTQTRYSYIESRKKLYLKEYVRLIRKLPIYQELLNKIKSGIKICIVEMDVPHSSKKGLHGQLTDSQEQYYPTTDTLIALLNDPVNAFGHGLCLAMALLEDLN